MMVALSAWNDRIAPLFDVAGKLHLVRLEAGRVVAEADELVPEGNAAEKARRLADRGVGLLICGAISRPVHLLIEAYGIRVIPFVTGPQAEVLATLVAGRLQSESRALPARRFDGRRGRGAGRSGLEAGVPGESDEPVPRRRMGPGGACVCPSCGFEEPHQQGVPCTRRRCPQCGQALIRR